jgi:hypothetical protein
VARLSAAGRGAAARPAGDARPAAALTLDEWSAGPAQPTSPVLRALPVQRDDAGDCARLRGIVAPTIGTEFIDLAAVTALGLPVAHGATAGTSRRRRWRP